MGAASAPATGGTTAAPNPGWLPTGDERQVRVKGIFALQPTVRFADATDGLTNTIMIGEVQRLDLGTDVTTSRDGWAMGGVSTHFSTCSDDCRGPNSRNFEEPGSQHPGGINSAWRTARFTSSATPLLSPPLRPWAAWDKAT